MILDVQRNLLTVLLVAGCGVVGVALLAQTIFMGRPDVEGIEAADSDGVVQREVDTPDPGLSELQHYSVITEYPLFFSDRRLPPLDPDALEDDVEEIVEIEEPEEPVEGLKARVTGIIVDGSSRMALVYDEEAGKTVRLQEGMSLEGEQADWRLDRIDPRLAHFVATDGKEEVLELEVYTSSLGEARSASRSRSRDDSDEDTPERGEESVGESGEDAARERAEEVRRRVAERRAQLREEAQRRQEESGGNDSDE